MKLSLVAVSRGDFEAIGEHTPENEESVKVFLARCTVRISTWSLSATTLLMVIVGKPRSLGSNTSDNAAISTFGIDPKKKLSILITVSSNEREMGRVSCLGLSVLIGKAKSHDNERGTAKEEGGDGRGVSRTGLTLERGREGVLGSTEESTT